MVCSPLRAVLQGAGVLSRKFRVGHHLIMQVVKTGGRPCYRGEVGKGNTEESEPQMKAESRWRRRQEDVTSEALTPAFSFLGNEPLPSGLSLVEWPPEHFLWPGSWDEKIPAVYLSSNNL